MTSVNIYALICPLTNKTRYVGQTMGTLKARLCGHVTTPHSKKNKEWILELKNKGLKPIIQSLEITSLENANKRELYWINNFSKQGAKLNNKAIPNKKPVPPAKKLIHVSLMMEQEIIDRIRSVSFNQKRIVSSMTRILIKESLIKYEKKITNKEQPNKHYE